MIIKNLIVNQLPEYHQIGQKPIRGLVSLNIGTQTTGNIKVFNINESLLPLCVAIKIGEQKFVFDDVATPQDYAFSLPAVDPSLPITLLLATNSKDGVEGLAIAVSPNGEQKYADLFEELSDKELNQAIDDSLAETKPKLFDNFDGGSEASTQSSQTDGGDSPTQNKEEGVQIEPTGNFYSLIQPQLDELFARFPHFVELEELVANTEWVKVNYAPDDTQHYILGKLYDGELVTHICYGIPAASRSSSPPESLTDYCQWLPLDLQNVDGAGYWVMYQSAETGENVRL